MGGEFTECSLRLCSAPQAELVKVADPAEYNTIKDFFLKSTSGGLTVINVERVINLPMWQSFAMKRQTVTMRYQSADGREGAERYNNHGELERCWLFHGTGPDTVPLIIQQVGVARLVAVASDNITL